jgi:hypothetical protein
MAIFNISGPSVNQNVSNQLTAVSVNAIRVKTISASLSTKITMGAPPELPLVGQIWPLGLV